MSLLRSGDLWYVFDVGRHMIYHGLALGVLVPLLA